MLTGKVVKSANLLRLKKQFFLLNYVKVCCDLSRKITKLDIRFKGSSWEFDMGVWTEFILFHGGMDRIYPFSFSLSSVDPIFSNIHHVQHK